MVSGHWLTSGPEPPNHVQLKLGPVRPTYLYIIVTQKLDREFEFLVNNRRESLVQTERSIFNILALDCYKVTKVSVTPPVFGTKFQNLGLLLLVAPDSCKPTGHGHIISFCRTPSFIMIAVGMAKI